MRPHSRGAMRPRFCVTFTLQECRGRRESRAPIAPAVVRTRGARVDHRFNRITPAFPARMVYGLLRALPGDRLVCHRRFADDRCISNPVGRMHLAQNLTPASGRQDHTTSPSATTFTERSAGLVQPGKVPSKTVCNAVRPRAGRSLTGTPALRSHCAPDAVASIASHRAFVTTRDPPLLG
jgi:hypothetical protein